MTALQWDVAETFADGGLGINPASIDGLTVLAGISSSGTANAIYSISDLQTLRTQLGVGPLVEAAAHHIGISGKPVLCVPIAAPGTASTAPALSAVTKVGGGGTVTVAGTNTDSFEVYIWINGTGVRGVGTFKYSLDAGQTYSPTYTIPSGGTFVLNYLGLTPTVSTGITVTFPAATYTAGTDYYYFTATAGGFSTSDVTATWNALVADPREWEFFHLVGQASSAANSATMAATLDGLLTTAETNHRFVWAMLEVGADSDANIISGFASTSSKRVMAVAGNCYQVSQVNGCINLRSQAWPVAARISAIPISQAASEVGLGSLTGVTSLKAVPTVAGTATIPPSGTLVSTTGLRDEAVTPGVDAARVCTLRSMVGESGFFVTQPNMLAAAGSDYKWAQYRRIADKAARLTRAALLPRLNSRLSPDPATGYIRTKQANSIEGHVLGQVNAGMGNDVSRVIFTINRADNLLTAQTLNTKLRIIPPAYATIINLDLGFLNPLLAT